MPQVTFHVCLCFIHACVCLCENTTLAACLPPAPPGSGLSHHTFPLFPPPQGICTCSGMCLLPPTPWEAASPGPAALSSRVTPSRGPSLTTLSKTEPDILHILYVVDSQKRPASVFHMHGLSLDCAQSSAELVSCSLTLGLVLHRAVPSFGRSEKEKVTLPNPG